MSGKPCGVCNAIGIAAKAKVTVSTYSYALKESSLREAFPQKF